jgi:hypothetical protein
MPDDTDQLPDVPTLRDRLVARGAKPHRRLSDLSRYMLAHEEELRALLEVDGYAWADIAALLAEEDGLTDETGKPVTAGSARLAWSRLRRRHRKSKDRGQDRGHDEGGTTARVEPAERESWAELTESLPDGIDDPNRVSRTTKRLPLVENAEAPLVIRPARPRGSVEFSQENPQEQAALPPKNAEAVAREIEDLARRQSGPKVAPPDVL